MSLLYRPVNRKNPQQPAAPGKWYAVAVSRGAVSIEQLLNAACEGNTLDRDEMRMGLNRAFAKATEYLELGFNVDLGELGHIGVSMRSNGADTPEEATAGQITDIVPHFVFGKNLRDRIRKCKVERETPKP
jgi:nucleoid DNA-binding protein